MSTKLFAGPVWDYDSSLGNYAKEHDLGYAKPGGVAVGADTGTKYYLLPAAYRQPDFYQEVVRTYHAVFVPILEMMLGERESDGTLRSIDELAAELAATAKMNQRRWPLFIRDSHPIDTGDTFEENIDYLQSFLSRRKTFLSETWVE